MNQATLFEDFAKADRTATAAHQPHSDTSKQAAADILKTANSLQVQVYEAIADQTAALASIRDWVDQQPAGTAGSFAVGATDEEIQTWLGMNPSTQRPRRVELVKKGLVVDSGKTRQTRSGRKATVWALKDGVK